MESADFWLFGYILIQSRHNFGGTLSSEAVSNDVIRWLATPTKVTKCSVPDTH
jgi:hypothetical protein